MALSEGNPAGSANAQGYDLFEGTSYRGLQRLRAGGMGEVWLVEHRGTRRKVIAKVIHSTLATDPKLLARMRLEAQAMGQLDDPHIVRVLDFGQTRSGRPFLVMEYLEGHTLADELSASGPLPLVEAVTFASQLLSALDAVHAKGLVHRDIKPDNLFICRLSNGTRCLKLLDFGVVRVMPGSESLKPLPLDYRTHEGVVVGTPRFVSPEGAMGQPVDTRADLYATGLMLYAMIVGRGPFDHLQGEQSLLSAHAGDLPPLPSSMSLGPVPPELERAILRALAKDPNERFQTAAEFQQLLDRVGESLRRPAGWLETTAFAASDLELFVSVAATAEPSEQQSGERPLPSQLSAIESSNAAAERQEAIERQPAETLLVLSPRAKLVLFVAAVLIGGLAAIGLVSLLRGSL
jgi:eukaryotic-like serine/threonine-protein kinase